MFEAIGSILVTVIGGIVCHYIIKWLDGDDDDNQPKEAPGDLHSPGASLCVHMIRQARSFDDIISYAKLNCNIRLGGYFLVYIL